MTSIKVIPVAFLSAILGAEHLAAQTPFQYREYTLGSSVASVVKISKTRQEETVTLHERPARIQQHQWRAPYQSSGIKLADPVRDVQFSFYDDQLYQVVVTYDRDRMEGLTNDDVIESISATYGVPLLRHAPVAQKGLVTVLPADTTIVAQWEDSDSALTLTRGTYSPQVQLTLVSKSLYLRARAAIKDAQQLDTEEAPQREQALRTKEAADARSASEKARVVNKAAFKP